MATKITNVYVKNRAAGETSFTEMDSVYVGGTRVFKKGEWTSTTTPQGVIPLKRVSSDTGPYGEYRSLFTEQEMMEIPYLTDSFGVLLMPIQYRGHIYIPMPQPVISGSPVYYILRVGIYPSTDSTMEIKIYEPSASTSGWVITEKALTDVGGALYAPTLTTTLYKVDHADFDTYPDRGQSSILCNSQSRIAKPGVSNSKHIAYFEMEYTRFNSSTGEPAPSIITVRSNVRTQISYPATAGYPLVFSTRNGTGRYFPGISSLYVN